MEYTYEDIKEGLNKMLDDKIMIARNVIKEKKLFGDNICHVEYDQGSYMIKTNITGITIGVSNQFKQYKNCSLRIMYDGMRYGTGDYDLIADTEDGDEIVYIWEDPDKCKDDKEILKVKTEFKDAKVIINKRKNGIEPTIFIIEDNIVYMVTSTPDRNFYITNEGSVGTRYNENGEWCVKE